MTYASSLRLGAGVVVWLIAAPLVIKPQAPVPQNSSRAAAAAESVVKVSRWRSLLDQQAIDARSLPDELRPEAMVAIADAYWELSPDKSKELFVATLDAALSIEKENTRQIALNRIISAAARRDPQLAKTLTQSILDKDNGAKHAIATAVELLNSDTQTAEAIALSSVAFGPSFDSAWLIF